ncbi:MAG: hypoxanthine phosphoribosyltransferase [Phycisphaerae bacterium]|nr:hypoxanthine phosphoribosyltransferase [Phycisphaerae bacterium]
MQADIDRILIPSGQIAARVKQLAHDITQTYADSEQGLMIVCVLSGSIVFVADLIRHLPIKTKIGSIAVSSYKGKTTRSLGPALIGRLEADVAGRNVLLVDDIIDTGQTLRLAQNELAAQGPASLRTCVLLRKPHRAPRDVRVDFVGFDVEDVFVVGYGLDYDGDYRNLPDVAVLKPHVYD